MSGPGRRRRSTTRALAIGSSAGGLVILSAGLLLVGLSVPKLLNAVAASTGESVIGRLQESQPVGAQGLTRARESLASAARILPSDYTAPRDLALIELIAAQRAAPDDPARMGYLEASIDAARQSLMNNPAQPYVWLRLSQAELLARGVGVEAALAFTMSLETGPQVIDLMRPRVILGLALWPVLDDQQQERVLAQIRGLARYNARILAETVLDRAGLPQVRRALADEPELMAQFLRWYLQRRTPGLRPPGLP
ncbi:MAG: hypothetical protein TEF_20035 [Rhizobiales bacterium NRL2]|jgi:hypothetical protein|nr:MAG: hypothetical protein TEF_20035 [Rhizobiales bacterium NRL2]